MSEEIEKFCDEKIRTATDSFMRIVAMDCAEASAEDSGIHPDYFMPTGMEYTREWPRLRSEPAGKETK